MTVTTGTATATRPAMSATATKSTSRKGVKRFPERGATMIWRTLHPEENQPPPSPTAGRLMSCLCQNGFRLSGALAPGALDFMTAL